MQYPQSFTPQTVQVWTEDTIRAIAGDVALKICQSALQVVPQEIAPDFLSKTEAQNYIRVSQPTLDKLVREGKINSYRPTPDRVVFYREDLKQYLLSQNKNRY